MGESNLKRLNTCIVSFSTSNIMASDKVIICTPGQRLCLAEEKYIGGNGTYSRQGYILSCLTGVVKITLQPDKKLLVEVHSGKEQTVVPSAGDVITARITQINPRWARCAILCVKDVVLAEPFRGILRREDVRATEKDRVEMYKCFRPNDVILARVLLGRRPFLRAIHGRERAGRGHCLQRGGRAHDTGRLARDAVPQDVRQRDAQSGQSGGAVRRSRADQPCQ